MSSRTGKVKVIDSFTPEGVRVGDKVMVTISDGNFFYGGARVGVGVVVVAYIMTDREITHFFDFQEAREKFDF